MPNQHISVTVQDGKPQLDDKKRHLDAYDGHQLTLLGLLTCDVEWNRSRHSQKNKVVQSVKKFCLLVRVLLPKHGTTSQPNIYLL